MVRSQNGSGRQCYEERRFRRENFILIYFFFRGNLLSATFMDIRKFLSEFFKMAAASRLAWPRVRSAGFNLLKLVLLFLARGRTGAKSLLVPC